MRIKSISNVISDLGESPIYDQARKMVSWTDITGLKWYEHNLDSGETNSQESDGIISALVFRESKGYVAAVKEGFATLNENESYVVTNNILDDNERMNDGKCDAKGRFWAGSTNFNFEKTKGKLFRLDTDFKCEILLDELTLPNGMDWSPDNKHFYLIDSLEYKLWKFEFELQSGTISNRKVLHEFNPQDGIPDGLSVSDQGHIVVAMYGGSSINVISPNGKLAQRTAIPVKNPTSCTFVGRKFQNLVVTSALTEQPNSNEFDGHTLLLENFGLRGKSSHKFQG